MTGCSWLKLHLMRSLFSHILNSCFIYGNCECDAASLCKSIWIKEPSVLTATQIDFTQVPMGLDVEFQLDMGAECQSENEKKSNPTKY